MSTGMKHSIRCRCVLPQFKRHVDPPQHQFVVFSVIQDDGTFVTRFAQCNNCGIVHKVTEVGQSTVVQRETMQSLISVDDVRRSLPSNLAELLDASSADLATWEMAQFIVENKRWGDFVVLSTDEEGGVRQGKYVRILGDNLLKVETFTREEVSSK